VNIAVELKDVVLGLLSLFATGISFLAKELWALHKEMQKELSQLKEELPHKYVRRDDFQTFRTEVLEAIGKLDDYIRRSLKPEK